MVMETNETIQALQKISFCALKISGRTEGRQSPSWHIMMASLAFGRLALNGLSILRLSPGSSLYIPEPFQIWDLPSVSSLSRNLVETYLTLHYFTRTNLSTDELQFRKNVWHYNEANERLKMLQLGVPKSVELPKLEQDLSQLKSKLEQSSLFNALPKDKRKRILQGEIAKLETKQQLCASAGVSQGYHGSIFKYGSNHTHSSPFSFSQLNNFQANDPSSRRVFNTAFDTSTGFIAMGVRDYVKLWPDQLSLMDSEEKRLVDFWEGILKNYDNHVANPN
jgi:hypothetical protein